MRKTSGVFLLVFSMLFLGAWQASAGSVVSKQALSSSEWQQLQSQEVEPSLQALSGGMENQTLWIIVGVVVVAAIAIAASGGSGGGGSSGGGY